MSSIGKPVYDPILGAMRSGLKPGAGIDMSGGTISVITPPEGVPYVAGEGVAINGATIGADLDAGYRMEIVSGSTIGQQRYFPIETVTGASVTLQAGHAYKVYATSTAITLNTETVPDGKFGLEGHLEIYVAGTGYVVTGTNVVLAEALEPDAVNNCTLRFHDGVCIISVEDHIAGYIVVNGSTAGDGSLYYGISTSTNEYVAFDASLNGTVIPLAGAVAEGEKHIVGNGYSETAISGNIDCSTAKVTVANLSLQDVGITSGTLTLGDVKIPSGSTVAVSGGGLAVEKVTGAGSASVIDLGGTNIVISSGTTASASGCVVSGGSASGNGGALYVGGKASFVSASFIGNSASTGGGGTYIINTQDVVFDRCYFGSNTAAIQGGAVALYGATVALSGCIFDDNTAVGSAFANCVYANGAFDLTINGGTFGSLQNIALRDSSGKCSIAGTIKMLGRINTMGYPVDTVPVTISSGAVVDLTGNTNATPIAPGGGITFEQGGAIVYPSAGQASAYMLGGMTVPQIGNTNVVNLGGARVVLSSNAYASGCTFTGGTAALVMYNAGNVLTLDDCAVIGNATAGASGGIWTESGTQLYLGSSIISGNSADEDIHGNGLCVVSDCTLGNVHRGQTGVVTFAGVNNLTSCYGGGSAVISSGASINLASSINPGGGIVVDGGCSVNGVAIAGGTYTSIVSSGGSAVINQ